MRYLICPYCGKKIDVDDFADLPSEHPHQEEFWEHECPHCDEIIYVSFELSIDFYISKDPEGLNAKGEKWEKN